MGGGEGKTEAARYEHETRRRQIPRERLPLMHDKEGRHRSKGEGGAIGEGAVLAQRRYAIEIVVGAVGARQKKDGKHEKRESRHGGQPIESA